MLKKFAAEDGIPRSVLPARTDAELYRDGSVFYKFNAELGTHKGAFNIDVICGEQSHSYQASIANAAGVSMDQIKSVARSVSKPL